MKLFSKNDSFLLFQIKNGPYLHVKSLFTFKIRKTISHIFFANLGHIDKFRPILKQSRPISNNFGQFWPILANSSPFGYSVQSAHIFPSSILGLCLAPLDWILVEPDRFRAAEYQPCVHYYTRHYVPVSLHTTRFAKFSFHSLSFSCPYQTNLLIFPFHTLYFN